MNGRIRAGAWRNHHSVRKFLIAVAAAALLGGPVVSTVHADGGFCSGGPTPGGDWAAAGGDAPNTRTQPAEDAIGVDQAKNLTVAWATQLDMGGSTGQVNAAPTEADGCVFIGTANGRVYALDAGTGTEVWHADFAAAAPGLGGTVVGSTVVDHGKVIVLVNDAADGNGIGPYVAAINEHTGNVLWSSRPYATYLGSYTNASPAVIPVGGKRVVFAGWSPPEGDSNGQGGFALVDAENGHILRTVEVIPDAEQAQGFAGAGIWSTPAFDAGTGYAYVGASNPYSKTKESELTNAVLKIDMRSAATMGDIAGHYKGVVDQYSEDLQALSHSPVCQATDEAGLPTAAFTFDDPACGQLDLDFGAPPNLFKLPDGTTVVGALQKAGIYHEFRADTLAPIWSTKVGGPCATCNAAATAAAPGVIGGVSAPGGNAFALDPVTGTVKWLTPLGGGVHYEGTSMADGVFYTFDTAGLLDVFDAETGALLGRYPMSTATLQPMVALTSAGVSIADHTVLVGASGGPANSETGWVIAYRPAP
jgi:outer membrane protein assembly factor BamB